MKILDQFNLALRPTPPLTTAVGWTAPAEPMTPLVGRLWALYAAAKLPHFNDEEVRQLAVLLDPELQGIVNDCIALLRRQPKLGEAIELTADWLQTQLALALELDRLEPLADDLTATAETAIAALLAALGSWNARVLLWVQGRIGDDARPEAERRRLRDQFRGALALEERQAEGRPVKRDGKKADALLKRAEAARGSQAVLAALRSLRGLLSNEGGAR